MVTGGDEASFTGVYKLAARNNPEGETLIPTMKFSDNPEKNTNPGIKNVWRLYDEEGMIKADIVALEGEDLDFTKENRFYHPSIDYRQFAFKPTQVEPLLVKRMEKGNLSRPRLPDGEQLLESNRRMKKQLANLDSSYKRFINPHIFKVSISEELKNLKLTFIQERIK